ncbi:MAG: adenylosuccinate synthetase [Solirubrobacteraceae bacterium]
MDRFGHWQRDCATNHARRRRPARSRRSAASPVHPPDAGHPRARVRRRTANHVGGHSRKRAVVAPRAVSEVTSRDTNVAGCLAEAGIAPARVRKVVVVVRTYPIRVGGASGPMTTELTWEEIERRSGLIGLANKEHTSKTNKLRRVGEPEWDLLRRAAVLNAPTDIALTFADYLSAKNGEA